MTKKLVRVMLEKRKAIHSSTGKLKFSSHPSLKKSPIQTSLNRLLAQLETGSLGVFIKSAGKNFFL